MIDLVLTYVDGRDKLWKHNYLVYTRIENKKYEANSVRFRSWDNFKYILRSAAQYLPFINNTYLIVSQESQVPDFINTDTVNIIYHRDIIPEKYLPTFNSNTIEMFIYKIPELSENFIYMNDDMLFLSEYDVSDFYDENMNPLVIVFEKAPTHNNIYMQSLRNTMKLANRENDKFKLNLSRHVLRSDHAPNPMKKSLWEYYWTKYEKEMSEAISRFRDPKNITQELSNYHYFMYYTTNNINGHGYRNSKYFDFVNSTSEDLEHLLFDNKISSTCINDAGVTDFKIYKDVTNKLLERRFPDKCKYEK